MPRIPEEPLRPGTLTDTSIVSSWLAESAEEAVARDAASGRLGLSDDTVLLVTDSCIAHALHQKATDRFRRTNNN